MTSLGRVCETIAHWLNLTRLDNPNWSPALWETFRFVCRVHGVAPLLHKTLKDVDWLDRSTRTWLAEQYRSNTQRLARMQAELGDILARFDQHDLPLMPLKGSILAATGYDEAGLRPMADLDLLIRPDDFARAATLLAALGYEQSTIHWKHTEFIKPDNRRVVSKEVEHPDNPRALELHLACRESFGGPTLDLTDLMWQNSARGTLLGQPAILPKIGPLWLHLVVHATYHLWQGRGRLLHLIDLVRLSPHVDDSLTLLAAVDARFTYPSLALLQRYFPTTLAGDLLPTLQKRISPSFRQWVDTLDLVNTSYLNPNAAGPYLFKALKFTGGRPREVAQALRFAFLPTLAEIALDHPRLAESKAPWLAYVLLPLDWAKRVGRSGR